MTSTLQAVFLAAHDGENSPLHQMIWAALLKAVNYVRAEDSSAAHHAARLQWASTICGGDNQPAPRREVVQQYVLLACTNGDVVTNIETINNGTHEALVEYIVNYQLSLVQ